MPIIRFPVAAAKALRCHRQFSSATLTEDQVVRLILDQKSADETVKTFRWASELPKFKHSQSTYRALVHKLCSFRRFDAVKDVLDEMPRALGSPPDESTFLTLVKGLGRAGMVRTAVKIPELAARLRGGDSAQSLKISNAVLDLLVKHSIDLARDFFHSHMMRSGGVGSDHYTHGILMKGLCSTNRISEAFKLLALIKSKPESSPNAVIYNTLIHALCRNGLVERARTLFDEMDDPSEVTFNIFVSEYCSRGDSVRALAMLEKCLEWGFLPDVVALTKILGVLCDSGRVLDAVGVLERVESRGGEVDVVTYNAIIRGFCGLREPRLGLGILKEMERKGCLPNTETYNVLVSGFSESGSVESAFDLFREMEAVGVKRNFASYDGMIRGFCSVGRIRDGIRVLELLEESEKGCEGRISPYNSVVYGLYKESRRDEALEFLNKMERLFPRAVAKSLKILSLSEEGKVDEAKMIYIEMISEGGFPSALVYGCLIDGFCREGNLREALELTNEMIGRGFLPIASTFNSIVLGFCGRGRVASAMKLIEDLVSRGCVLDAESYSHVVEGLCKEGDFQEALKVFSLMTENGVVPNYSSWSTVVVRLSQETKWFEKNQKAYTKMILEDVIDTC